MILLYYALAFISVFFFYGLLENTLNHFLLEMLSNTFRLIITFLFYLHIKRGYTHKDAWKKRKMSIKAFFLILSLVLSQDIITITLMKTINTIKGAEGAIIPGTVDHIGTSPETIIHAVIIGPIIEELVFRGAGLNLFKKQDNKLEAIIFTSVIFGLIHGNFAQAINATMGGFILGYVAIEFGIIYSIIFHILNNGMTYVIYFLNLSGEPYGIIAKIILLCWILNIKKVVKKLKNDLSSEKPFSIQRQLAYFCNVIIILYGILWIIQIILSI